MRTQLSVLSRYAARLFTWASATAPLRRADRRPRRRDSWRLYAAAEVLEQRFVLTAVAAPSGLISWWTANGTPNDLMGLNNASLFNPNYSQLVQMNGLVVRTSC